MRKIKLKHKTDGFSIKTRSFNLYVYVTLLEYLAVTSTWHGSFSMLFYSKHKESSKGEPDKLKGNTLQITDKILKPHFAG